MGFFAHVLNRKGLQGFQEFWGKVGGPELPGKEIACWIWEQQEWEQQEKVSSSLFVGSFAGIECWLWTGQPRTWSGGRDSLGLRVEETESDPC